MLEQILDRRQLEKALITVERNKGAGGVDDMQSDELRQFINTNYQQLCERVLSGNYRPDPVKKVEISKPQGGVRLLGIPTVKDRLLQTAVCQWLAPQVDKDFHKNSYGFRPGRNAQQAVTAAAAFLNEGYDWIIELDLEKFFDRVNHVKLLGILGKRISDKRIMRLIKLWLKSGIMEGGLTSQRTEGTPQGSPLSPLLSNILLDELDKTLESRGHRFVRYADDCSIYVKSEKAAIRVMEVIVNYLENGLALKVNKEKSKISRPHESYLLGFSFFKKEEKYQIRVAPKSLERILRKCKEITKSSSSLNIETKLNKLDQICRGWVNYFRIAQAKTLVLELDRMIRTRLRINAWRRWKRIRTKLKNLVKLGVKPRKAYEWANTSKGACRAAHSFILTTTLTNAYWRKVGYRGFSLYYSWKTETQTLNFN